MAVPEPHSQRYNYSPLSADQFRVVKILPGTGDVVDLKIEIVSVTSVPHYRALSYCWGDSEERLKCQCLEDGKAPSNLYVSEALHQALKQIRHDSNEMPIWIDQVCINQDDEEEKIHQIRLMKQIYKSAYQVVIWLGEADHDTQLVFDLMKDVYNQFIERAKAVGVEKTIYNPADPYSAHCLLNLTPADAREWIAFRKFLQRPWFDRVWTVQELVLAKRNVIVCGSYDTSWQQLHYVCQCLQQVDYQRESHKSYLKLTDRDISFLGTCWYYENGLALTNPDLWQEIKPCMQFTNLLRRMMPRRTSEPQDKIYGIVGLAIDIDPHAYPITADQHFRRVYSYATKYIIDQYSDLEILRRTAIQPTTYNEKFKFGPRNCPSWIPDYRYDRISTDILWSSGGPYLAQHGRSRRYNATGLSKTSIEVDDSLELRLQGVLLGTIKDISDSDGCGIGNTTLGQNVLIGGQWASMAASLCLSDEIYPPTNEPIHLAYARLRLRDYLPLEYTRADRIARSQPLLSIPEPSPSTFLISPNGEKLLHHTKDDRITPMIMRSCKHSTLALLNTGYMGLVHQSCTIDDEVWLVMGGDMPFVLRPLVTGQYEFKGEAYVHGVMEGEQLIRNHKLPTDRRDNQGWLDELAEEVPFETKELILI